MMCIIDAQNRCFFTFTSCLTVQSSILASSSAGDRHIIKGEAYISGFWLFSFLLIHALVLQRRCARFRPGRRVGGLSSLRATLWWRARLELPLRRQTQPLLPASVRGWAYLAFPRLHQFPNGEPLLNGDAGQTQADVDPHRGQRAGSPLSNKSRTARVPHKMHAHPTSSFHGGQASSDAWCVNLSVDNCPFCRLPSCQTQWIDGSCCRPLAQQPLCRQENMSRLPVILGVLMWPVTHACL